MGLAALLAGAGALDYAARPAASDAILKAELIDAQAPYPQAHASTIVQLSDGSLMAAWFAGSGEGNADVRIWTSRNGGGKGDG